MARGLRPVALSGFAASGSLLPLGSEPYLEQCFEVYSLLSSARLGFVVLGYTKFVHSQEGNGFAP